MFDAIKNFKQSRRLQQYIIVSILFMMALPLPAAHAKSSVADDKRNPNPHSHVYEGDVAAPENGLGYIWAD